MREASSTRVSTTRRNPLRTAPNLLTVLRICLAPFLVAAILEDRFGLGFAIFVAAGLTDALDGVLARVLKQRTVLGQYLDPIADKLLLSTLFLVLMYKDLMPTTVTVLVLGRDVGILASCGSLVRRRGTQGVRPQHLRQSQYLGAGDGGGSCAAAPAYYRKVDCNLAPRGTRCDGSTNRGFRPALCLDIASHRTSAQSSGPPAEVTRSRVGKSVLNVLDC